MTIQEMKQSAVNKFCQGDVNIYALPQDPGVQGKRWESPVLVIGQSGNHHRLVGESVMVQQLESGEFLLQVSGKRVALDHQQHKPPIALKPGFYLVDRAREKGVFDDMIAPVAD